MSDGNLPHSGNSRANLRNSVMLHTSIKAGRFADRQAASRAQQNQVVDAFLHKHSFPPPSLHFIAHLNSISQAQMVSHDLALSIGIAIALALWQATLLRSTGFQKIGWSKLFSQSKQINTRVPSPRSNANRTQTTQASNTTVASCCLSASHWPC